MTSTGQGPIYLDYNATTPLAEEVIEEVQKSLIEDWGNPSSAYFFGKVAKAHIDIARGQLASMVNCQPGDIVFTSGGTEANNMAILSAVRAAEESFTKYTPHVVTSNVEHDSVAKVLDHLEKLGRIELSFAKVDPNNGILTPEAVTTLIRDNTCLVTLMHANNETGLLLPIEQVGSEIRKLNEKRGKEGLPRILYHSDAAQTIGKVKVDVNALGVDYLTIVGHKFYGPRIGVLFAKGLPNSKTPVFPLQLGGGQERGYRPGTENTPMIRGLGVAARLVNEHLENYSKDMKDSRDYFQEKATTLIPGVAVNFREGRRLPNTLSLLLPPGVFAAQVLEKCQNVFCASLGAACHSHAGQVPSKVLLASGLTEDEAIRTIRFSVGRQTRIEELDMVIDALKNNL